MKTLTDLQMMAELGELHGLFPGITDDVYHHPDAPGKSSTFFKTLLHETPLHAVTKLKEEQEKDAFIFGRAGHVRVQDPIEFGLKYTFTPEGMRRDKRSKDYQEFLAANEGKEILSYDEYTTLMKMGSVFDKHPLAKLLKGALVEHSGFWTEGDTLCKIRPDFFVDGVVYDYKTTAHGIGPFEFSRSVANFGYHISAAMYLRGLSAITGEKLKRFVLIAQEKKPPFDLVFYDIDDATIEKGEEEFLRALDIYRGCESKGEFPGHPQTFQTISLPAYAWSL